MRAAFLEYADFGHPSRGEGLLAYYDVAESARRGVVSRVYSRDVHRSPLTAPFNHLVQKPIPGGNTIPRALSGIRRLLFQNFPAADLSEQIMDFFSSRELKSLEFDVLVTYPRMVRSLQESRRLGKITIVRAVDLAPQWKQSQLASEQQDLGIKLVDESASPILERRTEASVELADYLVVFSEFQKSTFVETGFPENRIFVCPLGVDLHRFQPPKSSFCERPRAVFVGAPIVRKGFHHLLQAWQSLDHPEAELIVCGQANRETKQLLERFSSPNVRMMGHVDPLPHLQQASLFVLPSLSEGFPKAVLEAMACGLPVVVTSASGSTVVRDQVHGFVVPIGDVPLLARMMGSLIEQPELRNRMAVACRARASEFTWDRYSNQMMSMLLAIAP